MAEAQLLDAINGIKTSMSTMEQQLKVAPTKADLNNIVSEIRGVKETVIRNTDRIDTLYDLRKNDNEKLVERVEKLVAGKVSSLPPGCRFLRSRRFMRLWPVGKAGGLEKRVKNFLGKVLLMPADVVDRLTIEKIEKQSQTRRSKIQNEVLIMLEASKQRDVIQSYAANLAADSTAVIGLV